MNETIENFILFFSKQNLLLQIFENYISDTMTLTNDDSLLLLIEEIRFCKICKIAGLTTVTRYFILLNMPFIFTKITITYMHTTGTIVAVRTGLEVNHFLVLAS